jgi:F0F1-type ATP synthase membrane subunit b/b'
MSKDTPNLYWALAYLRLHEHEDVRTQALALCDEIETRVTEARASARAQAFEEAAHLVDNILGDESDANTGIALTIREMRRLRP